MQRRIEQVSPSTKLFEAAQRMRDRRVGSLLIGDPGKPVGILSETDLVRKAIAEGLDLQATSVEAIMSRPIIGIDLDKTAGDACNLMAAHDIRHLAVTDGEKIVGILSVKDLLICFKNRL
jgi:CBS domain-containing protein